MDVSRFKYQKKTKIFLVFFCFLLVFGCEKKREISDVKVNYEDDKAIDVSFVSDNYEGFSIHLNDNLMPVLGSFSSESNNQTYTPIIPFTNGETYTIKKEQHIISSFTIKAQKSSKSPELLAIYPTTDIVPENLLKMYFKFSEPMQEVGNVLDFISVFNKTTNKKVEVFLELETELWNANHTILTLWLDPGRVKKDLIPNKEKGTPILNGDNYEILVSKNFRDANGNNLKQAYSKTFAAGEQDKSKPEAKNFDIIIPKDKTYPLYIQFKESLDAILSTEVFSILNDRNQEVIGAYNLQNGETSIAFVPMKNWEPGKYRIQILSKLEDLAGNNLNRLFDEDLLNKKNMEFSSFREIYFSIK